jgi:putative ABC transport system substrate-binding protein
VVLNRCAFVCGAIVPLAAAGRVAIYLGLLLALLVAPFLSEAQQADRPYAIGLLTQAACSAPPHSGDRFRQALRDLGYVEGRTIGIECRSAGGDTARLLGLAAELLTLKVDVLVTEGTLAALAAQRTTTTTPIVVSFVADAVATGLVASLARPGGNVTGLSIFGPESIPKQLELLKEAAPWISRVAFVADLSNPGSIAELALQNAAARTLRVELHPVDVRSPADLDAALAVIQRQRAEALVLGPLPIRLQDAERIMDFAVKNRLATVGNVSRLYAEAGVLLFWTPNIVEQYQRLASLVDKIRRGTKPADLPVEQPSRFEVTINLKTARALGLTIPPSLLLRAHQVID